MGKSIELELAVGPRDDAAAAAAAAMFDLDEEVKGQVTHNDLMQTNQLLKWIGLARLFEKRVEQPVGEIDSIKMQVPFTVKFAAEQRAAGKAMRKTNAVYTSKYSIWSFIPKAGLFQFLRFTNAFYLCIGVIAFIGYNYPNLWVVSYDPITIVIVLVVVVGVALIFEGVDDLGRHKKDAKTNGSVVERVREGHIESTTWGHLVPGDLIIVENQQIVPADIILVSSFGADNSGQICYIETASIDGETNLKIKEVPSSFHENLTQKSAGSSKLKRAASSKIVRGQSTRLQLDEKKDTFAQVLWKQVSGLYDYEQPNALLQFNGTFSPYDKPHVKHSLSFENLVLRGSVLRNTKYIFGVVAYSGPETKLALSKEEAPQKFSQMDRFMNRILLFVFFLMILLVVAAVMALFLNTPSTTGWWYFGYTSSTNDYAVPGPIAFIFTYLILFANIIPIPIIICVEVSNFYFQRIINWDLSMYHEQTDTRANCSNSSLVSEIGQITHVFSDKTGTLTRNEMKLVGCFVNGEMHGYVPPIVEEEGDEGGDGSADIESGDGPARGGGEGDDDSQSLKSIDVKEVFTLVTELLLDNSEEMKDDPGRKALWEFFLLLALCHTVVVDFDDSGEILYNAESPDEFAFVKAAKVLGFTLLETSDGKMTITTPLGEERKYKILAVNPFNSTRKRMSIVLQCCATQDVILLMKGADNVMIPLLAPGQEAQIPALSTALDRYAWNGLRTLIMASRTLTQREFIEWDAVHKAAKVSAPKERSEALSQAASLIEKDVTIIGASAIEDQLQLGVPQAIQTLRDAGAQVWVLTGDKIETAINIGLSSNLIDSTMMQIKLTSGDVEELNDQLSTICTVLDSLMTEDKDNMDAFRNELLFPDQSNNVSSDSSGPSATSSRLKKKMTTNMNYNLKKEQLAKLASQLKKQQLVEQGAQSPSRWFDNFYVSCPSAAVLCRHFADSIRHVVLASYSSSAPEELQINAALVVSGLSMQLLLQAQKGSPELEAKLLKVARFCKVVLACRVSPAQKSLIVEMVRHAPDNHLRKLRPVTLAIGDGANDVPMIQSAHVGVGISGHEGQQAVNSADFSIAQFRFLVDLMLVHGRWNYRRQANMILFIIYSWILYTLLLFFYLPECMFSGSQVYYNLVYISLFAYFANIVIIAHALWDRDVSRDVILRNPWTYGHTVHGKDLRLVKLMVYVVRAAAHAAIIFVISVFSLPDDTTGERLGAAVFNSLVCTLLVLSMAAGNTITAYNILVFGIITVLYLVVMGIASDPNMVFTPPSVASLLWANTFLCIVSVFVLDFGILYAKYEFFPTALQILQEQDRGYFLGEKVEDQNKALMVLREFGLLTIKPITVGTKNIVKLAEQFAEGKDKTDVPSQQLQEGEGDHASQHDAQSHGSGGKFNVDKVSKAVSSTFTRFRPNFDIDMPSFGSSVVSKISGSSALRHLGLGSKEHSSPVQDSHSSNAMAHVASRFELSSLASTGSPSNTTPEPMPVLQEESESRPTDLGLDHVVAASDQQETPDASQGDKIEK